MILLLVSCSKPDKKETIEKFVIFGYSGFCIKDSANWIGDSTRLDIRQYFEYIKDSCVRTTRRSYLKPTEYHTIISADTIGLENLLETILLGKIFKNNYPVDSHSMYDGWYYTLYYKTTKHKECIIHYVPGKLPDQLRILHDFIEKIILTDRPVNIARFEYDPITTIEAKKLFRSNPPPPQTEIIVQKVKFTPPIIVDSNINRNE